jgi:hypothetical protein
MGTLLVICTWLWGAEYPQADVFKLRNGIARHLKQPHRFLVMTEPERKWDVGSTMERFPILDRELLLHKGCFARLRMFERMWQHELGVDDRLVCLDLDMVITGGLDQVFDRPEPFVILSGANSINPCPFNGSVMMLRPGQNEEVWTTFSVEAARKIPHFEFPDDQGWIWHKLPKASTWPAGKKSGIYAFRKPGWPTGIPINDLPENARIVAFPGARRPQQFAGVKWVRENWK